MSTWTKAKRDWFKGQRAEIEANKSHAENRADLARMLTDERTIGLLSPWFDRLAKAQEKGKT